MDPSFWSDCDTDGDGVEDDQSWNPWQGGLEPDLAGPDLDDSTDLNLSCAFYNTDFEAVFNSSCDAFVRPTVCESDDAYYATGHEFYELGRP